MSIKWNGKIEVDMSDIESIEKYREIIIPEELKLFIIKYNGCSPDKYCFKIKEQEEIFSAVLNFNTHSTEGSHIVTALNVINKHDLLPFAIDPFGNYICYNINSKIIYFWNTELCLEMEIIDNLKNLILELY